MNIKLFLVFLLCITLLAACGRAATPIMLAPLSDTTATHTTQSPAAAPTITATRIASPTFTPRSSDTPTLSQPTRSSTENAVTALTNDASNQEATQIASFKISCKDYHPDNISLSPERHWLAISCGYSKNQTLEIVNKEGKQWVLHFKDYLAKEFIRDGETGLGRLNPVHWTTDDQYLYFTSNLGVSGGGTCFYGFGPSGLFRIDLYTGAVSTILSPSYSVPFYEIAFSPKGGKLAYIADHPAILDFRSGEKIEFDAGKVVVGNLT